MSSEPVVTVALCSVAAVEWLQEDRLVVQLYQESEEEGRGALASKIFGSGEFSTKSIIIVEPTDLTLFVKNEIVLTRSSIKKISDLYKC